MNASLSLILLHRQNGWSGKQVNNTERMALPAFPTETTLQTVYVNPDLFEDKFSKLRFKFLNVYPWVQRPDFQELESHLDFNKRSVFCKTSM